MSEEKANMYAKGKIYKVISNSTEKIYIGSTCRDPRHRLSQHLSHKNTSCNQLLQNDDYDIIIIENYPCKNKEELHARERYWIEKYKLICVNIKRPIINEKERQEHDVK